jgi:hypothetical protein
MSIQDFLRLLAVGGFVPGILIVSGIAFLLFSVLQKASVSTETKPGDEKFAILKSGKNRFTAFVGMVFLLAGIGLYLL